MKKKKAPNFQALAVCFILFAVLATAGVIYLVDITSETTTETTTESETQIAASTGAKKSSAKGLPSPKPKPTATQKAEKKETEKKPTVAFLNDTPELTRSSSAVKTRTVELKIAEPKKTAKIYAAKAGVEPANLKTRPRTVSPKNFFANIAAENGYGKFNQSPAFDRHWFNESQKNPMWEKFLSLNLIPYGSADYHKRLYQQIIRQPEYKLDKDDEYITRAIIQEESQWLNQPSKQHVCCTFGLFQITGDNDPGLIRFTPTGNIKLGIKMYKKQGVQPWDWSRHLWDNESKYPGIKAALRRKGF